jgi:PAS domain S-box-containing protein
MAIGHGKDDPDKPLDQQGGGQSAGIPAEGELDASSFNPMGNPGLQHWQAGFITQPGLGERGNIFFAVIQMTRMPMLITDPNQPDEPIVFANRAFLDLTEYTEEQVLGRNCRFLQGKETDPRAVEEIRMAVRDQQAVAVDIINYKRSGTPFWNALFIGPVFDEAGKLLYHFSSQLDITRRRVSENAYLQAQKMEAVGQLSAGLAHDFNNLLQVVSGNQEIAMHLVQGNEPAIKAIERAQASTEKAAKLTQQLLSFARKQRLEPKSVSLNALVVEFSELLARTLGDKVELLLELKSGIPSCEVDPTHFEMALLNVLINARDAMPNGGKVTVRTSVMTDKDRIEAHDLLPGNYVVLCVIDEGEGMRPEVVQRATEPFFTTKGPGTGLGLAMVHGFVQQSHGRMEIDSAPGKGTTIRMIFPVAGRSAFEREAERANEQRSEDAKEWDVESIVGRKVILVVDDSEDVRELAASHLQSLGYRVMVAPSGEDALTLLDQHAAVDLLLTDILMPGGMNGLQLVEQVRERMPDLPVLIATAYIEDLSLGSSGGVKGPLNILSKPFRLADLTERVQAVLEKKPLKDAALDFKREG